MAGIAPKWIYHVPKAEELEGVPVVADGVMYVSQADEVDALDARTGRLIWQYQRPGARRAFNRGLAIYEQRIYLGTTDAALVALDALTGGVIWENSTADWEWVLGVNVWGVIHGVRVFVPIMLRQNTPCHVVSTASAVTPRSETARPIQNDHGSYV